MFAGMSAIWYSHEGLGRAPLGDALESRTGPSYVPSAPEPCADPSTRSASGSGMASDCHNKGQRHFAPRMANPPTRRLRKFCICINEKSANFSMRNSSLKMGGTRGHMSRIAA